MDNKKLIEVQTKALLIHAPGVGFLIKTEDGQRLALSTGLAQDIANQIMIQTQAQSVPADPRSSYLQ